MFFGVIFGVFRIAKAIYSVTKIIRRAMAFVAHELRDLKQKFKRHEHEYRNNQHPITVKVKVKQTWRGAAIASQMQDAVQRAMTEVVADAAAMAQTLAPVDTGNLKNSITFEAPTRRGNGWVASVGSYTVSYALWVELGTRRMAAQPWLRPSVDRTFPSLPSRIRANMAA